MATKEVDVQLIFPPPSAYMPKDAWGNYLLAMAPPVGMLYLASYLLDKGYSVEILDGAVMAAKGRSLKEAIRETRARVVGLSCVTMNARNTLRVGQYVKSVHPETAIVTGGPHPSFCYDEFLDGGHDATVFFEGELAFGDLVEHYLGSDGADHHGSSLADITGIAFRENGETIVPDRRPMLRDIDELPPPARYLINNEDYAMPGIMLTGRGCPFDCVFCAAGPLSGRGFRKHSIDRVIDEIQDNVENYGLQTLFFADDCFTAARKRAAAICDRILELPYRIKWVCEGRVDTVNYELLKKMRAAGCVGIQYGVESGSEKILKHIHKRTKIQEIKDAVRWACELGIKAECSLQVGHPEDTRETILETLELARELRSYSTFSGQVATEFSITTPLPGTDLRNNAEELGVEILTNDWDRYTFIEPVINTRHLKGEELARFVVETMFTRMGHEDDHGQHGRLIALLADKENRNVAAGSGGYSLGDGRAE